MFINCPYCNALVATDPATDLPPQRCPRCASGLHLPQVQTLPGDVVPLLKAAGLSVAMSPTVDVVAGQDAPVAQDEATEREDDNETTGVSVVDGEPRAGTVEEAVAVAAETTIGAALVSENEMAIEVETETDIEVATDAESVDKRYDVTLETDPGPAPLLAQTMPERPQSDPPNAPAASAEVAIESAVSAESARAGVAPTPAVPSPSARTERLAKATPSFVHAPGVRAASPAVRDWRLPAAIAILTLSLGLQLLLADRAELAENARWRPAITAFCSALHCTLPPWRETEAFILLERDVRPHPSVPGALRVTASFRNDARWPQPWPRLALTLSDIDGREAGTRSFDASEYLGATPTQSELESGQTATIAMDVIEPAPRIVAFTFEFR